MRFLAALLILLTAPAFAAAPRPTSLTFTQGNTVRTLPVPPVSAWGKGQIVYTETLAANGCTFALGAQWVRFDLPCDTITRAWVYPAPPTCPPIPADAQQDVPCKNGAGTWHQSHGWTQSAPPQCALTALPWTPSAPRPTDCVVIPPGGFKVDLSYVDKSGAPYADFIGQASRDDASATDLIKAFVLTGTDSYRARAVTAIDAYFNDVQADINAGRNPDLASDSYLYAGGHIAEMSFVYAYGNPSAAQKASWKSIADQTIFNIWNFNQAKWGTRSAPWSGWATDDPDDNYHMEFMLGTTAWALASGEQSLLDYTNNVRWPYFDAAWGQNLGGGSLEGTGYGYRMSSVFWVYEFWRASGMGDRGNATVQMKNTAESWIHGTLPTMDLFVPIGDQSRVSMPVIYDYQRALVEIACYLTNDAAVKSDCGWWLSHIALQHDDMYRGNYGDDLYPYNASAPEPAAKTFRSPSVGFASGRTSWTPTATFLSVLMGKLSQSHAHREQGSFIFYKDTWLSVTANINSHSGINASYKGKNVIRFTKGGQVKQQDWATVNVTSYVANPATGEFHMTGDLTPLYQIGDNLGVNGWQRTIDFVGGVATISDSVSLQAETRDANGRVLIPATTATFQLQVPTTAAPTIAGNVITAGHLRATVLAPANVTFTVVDMRTVSDDGGAGDYERGWRVEFPVPSTGSQVRLEAIP